MHLAQGPIDRSILHPPSAQVERKRASEHLSGSFLHSLSILPFFPSKGSSIDALAFGQSECVTGKHTLQFKTTGQFNCPTLPLAGGLTVSCALCAVCLLTLHFAPLEELQPSNFILTPFTTPVSDSVMNGQKMHSYLLDLLLRTHQKSKLKCSSTRNKER